MLKRDYPRAITDLFGIPPKMGGGGFWMARNDTVSEEWVRLIAGKTGVQYRSDKVSTMKAIVEAVGQRWDPVTMSSTQTASGGGGNISKPAFEAVLRGLQAHPEVVRRRQAERARDERARETRDLTTLPTPDREDDQRVLSAIQVRRGQARFRKALLRAYSGRCALSGCDAEAALEAAHVRQYGQGGSYKVTNGLLLRADLHTLFDLHLLSVDVDEQRVLLAPALSTTTYGKERLRWQPPSGSDAPDAEGLRQHRAACPF